MTKPASSARILSELKQSTETVIYEHSDQAIRVAKLWHMLLCTATTCKRARYLGFTYIRTQRQLGDARRTLARYIRIFGY